MNPKKLKLIKAAEKCFAKQGYTQTSIREIADAADTNSCMITYYFGSKENLIIELIDFRAKTFRGLMSVYQLGNKNSIQVLLILAKVYLRNVFSEISFYVIIIQLYVTGNEKLLLSKLYALRAENLAFVEELVYRGKDEGVFSYETRAEGLSDLITASANHFVINLPFLKWKAGYTGGDQKFLALLRSSAIEELQKLLMASIG